MRKLPNEFSDLLNEAGSRILLGQVENVRSLFSRSGKSFIVLNDLIDSRTAADCMRVLDNALYPHLTPMSHRIPADSINKTPRRYQESLEKTLRVKTAFLNRTTARSYQEAKRINLLEMLCSNGFIQFAEVTTGFRLSQEISYQVFCYDHGDYVGPHTDHYPEDPTLREGYIDVHIMFSNSAVDHQWLVYEEKGHLSRIVDISLPGTIAVYKLPFWHYTTPLVGKPGQEATARRWVIVGTFSLLTSPGATQ